MALFRDRIALEACPAKTAESVSYVATFIVLGVLILSNYSKIADEEQALQSSVQTASSVSTIAARSYPNSNQPDTAAGVDRQQWSDGTSPAATGLARTDSASDAELVAASPQSWHADLQAIQPIESQAQRRAFSAVDWAITPGETEQSFADYNRDPGLPLLRIDPLFLLGTDTNLETSSPSQQLANNGSEPSQRTIHEITVTGAEIDRLRSRPDNILRPQLPRPYRAQQIQRSLVLPPRIQALRP